MAKISSIKRYLVNSLWCSRSTKSSNNGLVCLVNIWKILSYGRSHRYLAELGQVGQILRIKVFADGNTCTGAGWQETNNWQCQNIGSLKCGNLFHFHSEHVINFVFYSCLRIHREICKKVEFYYYSNQIRKLNYSMQAFPQFCRMSINFFSILHIY